MLVPDSREGGHDAVDVVGLAVHAESNDFTLANVNLLHGDWGPSAAMSARNIVITEYNSLA